MTSEPEITQLLVAWKAGDPGARDQLIPIVYQELHRIASRYLRNEHSAQTLQPTALVHEAYIRLVRHQLPDWESRSHFIGVAAYLMRQLLVEHARRNHTQKRGNGVNKVPLNEALSFSADDSGVILDLDAALDSLARFDERKSRIIELRFFGGLSIQEVAQSLSLSVATIAREQRLAEAWLCREMTSGQQ